MNINSIYSSIVYLLGSKLNSLYSVFSSFQENRITKNESNNKVISITKSHHYIFPDQDKHYMENEISILSYLNTIKSFRTENISVNSVNVIQSSNSDKTISLTTKFVDSKSLENAIRSSQLLVLKAVVKYLCKININLKSNLPLPKKTPFFFLLTAPIFTLLSIFKDLTHIADYLLALKNFYKYFDYDRLIESKIGLVHRDLFNCNILWNEKTNEVHILDWESAILADPIYELALIVWQHHTRLNSNDLLKIFEPQISGLSSQKHFISLLYFVVLQARAQEKISSHMYVDASLLLKKIKSNFIDSLNFPKLTFYENIFYKMLWLIALINKLLSKKIFNQSSLVLCYHSVNNDGWRFSTPVSDFEQQIDWLSKNYSFRKLSELSKKRYHNSVGISFDDGYLDVLTNASPILSKYKVVPTIFFLGDPDNANRAELDNLLPIMNSKEVKRVEKIGWEIGFHTLTHPDTSALDKAGIFKEITTGKKLLDQMLLKPTSTFAYPKGFYSNDIVAAVKEAGFKTAWSVDNGSVFSNNSEFLLDRVAIDGRWSFVQFKAALSPLGMLLSSWSWKVLQLKDKIQNFSR